MTNSKWSALATGFAYLLITAGAPVQAQTPATTETALHSFGGLQGTNPYAGLTADAAGNFYGTTSAGGTVDLGVVFKLDTTRVERVLHYFHGGADGATPYSNVTFDTAGNLYGTTYLGGAANAGVVYKLDASGQETVLYSFKGGSDGANPYAGLILDSSGNLYGTTTSGGGAQAGVVFRIDATGQETVLYRFTGGADGSAPYGGVTLDPAGNLYGTTVGGGKGKSGVVFKLDASGQETVLYSFTGGDDGDAPYAGVIRGVAGDLYGTTISGGGAQDKGILFRISPAGQETVIHRFRGSDGGNPKAGVVFDGSGNLYGTTYDGGDSGTGNVYRVDTAGALTVLYSFPSEPGNAPNGIYPAAGVILDAEGNIYGTTFIGGPGIGAGSYGYNGVVYKVDTTGKETLLCTFTNGDGLNPAAGVIRDPAGNLYGAATYGGTLGQGIIFKIDTSGRFTVLYNFTGGDEGGYPIYGVVRDSTGNLYGTAAALNHPRGVVFKLNAAGDYTVLYSFTNSANAAPSSGVILDAAGNLYGTTNAVSAPSNCGSVYRLNPSGQFTVLYAFAGSDGPDGCNPRGGLIFDSNGNLYGTTGNGGTENSGTVFKLEPSGQETVLYSFTGDAEPYTGVVRDATGNLYGTVSYYVYELDAAGNFTMLYSLGGALQLSGLLRDEAGNLYGTAYPAGSAGYGVVYKIDTAGNYTALYGFSDGADGGIPSSGVILDPTGNLYGTTRSGGTGGNGVVYKLTPEAAAN